MRKSKNRYFYHIFVSPGDAPGAITLNVVWMEREFDAYKLCPACAHLTITVSEIERDIGRKSSFFHTPLHSHRGVPVGIAPLRLLCMEKLEWLGYLTRLDHGNATLAGIPLYLLKRLQSVMNSAVRGTSTSPRSSVNYTG